MGLNMHTGEPLDPQMEGIFDNYSVKRQIINSGYILFFFFNFTGQNWFEKNCFIFPCLSIPDWLLCSPVITSQLLLVDEVIRAGRNMRKPT